MTTYTRADIATRALRDLGLVASDEAPSADDQVYAEETIASVYAEMAARGISLPNGSDEALPLELLAIVTRRVALDIAPAFGLASIADSEAAKPVLERNLREIAAKPPSGAVADAEYF